MNWQPIETAPRDGTPILTYSRGCTPQEAQMVMWWDSHRAMTRANGWAAYEVTHYISPDFWKPLDPPPPAPKEGD